MGSSHGVGPEHEAYAMGCHCGTCRPGAAVKPLTYDETSAKAIEQSRFAGQKEASMGIKVSTDGLQFVPPIAREQYEAWIKASRKRARRERIVRRMVYAALGIGAILALFLLMVAVSHAAPEPRPYESRAQVQEPKPEQGGLVEAQVKCEQGHGEWFVDDKSEGLPPGAKVVGCFWIVPKDMK